MTARVAPQSLLALLVCVVLGVVPHTPAAGQGRDDVRPLTWADLPQLLHPRLAAAGITGSAFPAHLARLRSTHAERVRAGDLDHLVFYLLQSTRFTPRAAIEPALSAKELVDSLAGQARTRFLAGGTLAVSHVPGAVRARAADLVAALGSRRRDARLDFFRAVLEMPPSAGAAEGRGKTEVLLREYLRVMRFVYHKEFVADRAADSTAVAELYRSRGLSTDTAVEAGFMVATGLGVVKGLAPERRIRRVLIVGPGLDLAPRTALQEEVAPASYQPWAVIDALVRLDLARLEDLEVVGADINPRVVAHLRAASLDPPALTLVSEIRDSNTITLSDDYRNYFATLGRAIGDTSGTAPQDARAPLRKTVRIRADAARVLSAHTLDIVTDRLDGRAFDLVIATNILPYFDDPELTLAIANIAAMLAPGGVFLHNEARPLMDDLTATVGLPFEQARHAVIATVRGAAAPLFDRVFLHRKAGAGDGRQRPISNSQLPTGELVSGSAGAQSWRTRPGTVERNPTTCETGYSFSPAPFFAWCSFCTPGDR